nr:rho GTPase-activating protein 6-like [Lytechinus pictus]
MTRDNKDGSSAPLVFGIALEKCIRNDREMRLYEANKQRERRESLDLAQPLLTPSTVNHLSEHSMSSSNKLARSISSPSSSRNRHPTVGTDSNATLLNALSLSTAAMDECRQMRRKSLAPLEPQVPRLVSQCFKHLEKHGVRVKGIFRVGGSKKRIRQVGRFFFTR